MKNLVFRKFSGFNVQRPDDPEMIHPFPEHMIYSHVQTIT